jgi:hypothetical protein
MHLAGADVFARELRWLQLDHLKTIALINADERSESPAV